MTDAAERPTRRHRLGPAAVAVAVLLVASAGAVAVTPGGPASLTPTPVNVALPVMPGAASPTPSACASGPLIDVADVLVAAPSDATRGRYYYLQVEQWSRSDAEIVGFRREVWLTDDGGLIRSEQRLPGQPAVSFDMARIGVPGTFDGVKPHRNTGDPAEVESFIERHGRPPGNPTELAKIIDGDNDGQPLTDPCPPACGLTIRPIVFFDAVTSLYRKTYLDLPARTALLRLVAVQPGITFLGEVTDRGGRKAIGVAVAEGGVRVSLLFDRNTGFLLASERSVPDHGLDDYTLYLTLDRRDSQTPTNGTAA
ncbi:hypothetical protein QEZ54_08845 [Catellatospora sp. KI3]|uniref:hypothetical protein n=1 Tax=Catellatospora sp. KI3 TaxID=3041620 RepID=UPI00248286BF|nr:hypothetical protein [Catellatospora sp. KI3]MDI1461069.1 hypothetical protein [Catellatospora sp. KI3]